MFAFDFKIKNYVLDVEEDSDKDSISAKTKDRKKGYLWRLLALPFIPILALIVQTTLALRHSLIYKQEVTEVEAQVK